MRIVMNNTQIHIQFGNDVKPFFDLVLM